MGVYLSESGYLTSNIYPRIRITHPGLGIIRISGISGREKRHWLQLSHFNPTDTKRTCCGRQSRNQMPELGVLGDSTRRRLRQTCFFSDQRTVFCKKVKIRHPRSYRAVNEIFMVFINTNPIRGLKYTSRATTYFKGSS